MIIITIYTITIITIIMITIIIIIEMIKMMMMIYIYNNNKVGTLEYQQENWKKHHKQVAERDQQWDAARKMSVSSRCN